MGAGSAIVPATVEVALDAVGRLTASAGLDAVGRLTASGGLATCSLLHRVDEAGNFLTIDGGLPVAFPAEHVGGLASPNAVLGAVNAARGAIPTGPVADVFGGANLLGVPLSALLAETQEQMPLLKSSQLPDALVTTYDWSPTLDTDQVSEAIRLEPGSTLDLSATITQPLEPTSRHPRPPTTEAKGTLRKATLSLLDVVLVRFEKIEFLVEANGTPSIAATGCKVSFAKDLKFVDDLAKEIGDFSGCPVKVDSAGITARYTLAIPFVGFGVFSLTNISLAAEVRIPFTGDPASVQFSFADRHSPFTVSVGIFGGGGFFTLTATTRELDRVEGSLDFGGNFEISALVASGRVFAMGGVSFLRADDEISLCGYLHCGGHLEILDVVGVSVEFQVALCYTDDPHGARVHGSATVTVGVQVLGFNESVSFTVEESFSVSDNRATPVQEQLDEAAWDQLCDAYV